MARRRLKSIRLSMVACWAVFAFALTVKWEWEERDTLQVVDHRSFGGRKAYESVGERDKPPDQLDSPKLSYLSEDATPFDQQRPTGNIDEMRAIKKQTRKRNSKTAPTRKKILYFTTLWNDAKFRFGVGAGKFRKCAVSSCEATAYRYIEDKDNHDFGQYDAVVFSLVHIDLNLDNATVASINRWRQPHQRFIAYGYENQNWSIKKGTLHNYKGFFNWTMTFRWDSDVPAPYGWFTSVLDTSATLIPRAPPKEWIQYVENQMDVGISPELKERFRSFARRPKKVAWLVSNWKSVSSKRVEYARELSKYIPIDIFGGAQGNGGGYFENQIPCNKKIGMSGGFNNCSEVIQRDYKFYLSFENSLCNDYATEKVYRNMKHAVTVSLGQANYTKLLPPHSTISVFDFENPKALADYLHYLDKDDTAYMSYFWWQKHYNVRSPFRSGPGFCLLCEKLHAEAPPKVYDDFLDWWRRPAECGRTLPMIKRMIGGRKQYNFL